MPTTVDLRSISREGAERALVAAVDRAEKMAVAVVVAVVDAAGELKAFVRMDGAPLISVRVAQDKAWTAAAFGLPTHEWWDLVRDDPPMLHGFVKTERLMIVGGGVPLVAGGAVVGGIGVSGSSADGDRQIAEAGAAAMAEGSHEEG
jgi:glc operon protein GlcG